MAVVGLIGDRVTSLLQSDLDGRFLLMMEMQGLDDPKNDDDVTFTVMRGALVPQYNANGIILPDQTYAIDDAFPKSVVEKAAVVDGVLEAGPIEFEVPIFIFDAAFGMKFNNGRLRIEIQEDGTFSGVMAGAVNIDAFLGEILQTAAAQEAELVLPIFQSYADMELVDGECKSFSAAFTFSHEISFVRYDDWGECARRIISGVLSWLISELGYRLRHADITVHHCLTSHCLLLVLPPEQMLPSICSVFRKDSYCQEQGSALPRICRFRVPR